MSGPKLRHISPEELLTDSFKLGKLVYKSGFRPRHAVSLWRGGTPVGLGVDAYFRMHGMFINHTSIATASYTGIDSREAVTVKGLDHLINTVCAEEPLLIIDDVYESGNTIKTIVDLMRSRARANAPENILIATLHNKPGRNVYKGSRLISLRDIPDDVWIDYPHELSDLYTAAGNTDDMILAKDPEIHRILNSGPFPVTDERTGNKFGNSERDGSGFIDGPHENGGFGSEFGGGAFKYLSPREHLYDSLKLGINIFKDGDFFPDFIIALWPGGVLTGLPVQEVFKYMILKEGRKVKSPDHVALNTSRHFTGYNSPWGKGDMIGMKYLEDNINKDDNVLIIDTTFRSGKLVNGVISSLKKTLKRNISLNRIKVACVYYNPEDKSTWTSNPIYDKPHFFLKIVDHEVIYPQNVAKLPDPRESLPRLAPELADILFGG